MFPAVETNTPAGRAATNPIAAGPIVEPRLRFAWVSGRDEPALWTNRPVCDLGCAIEDHPEGTGYFFLASHGGLDAAFLAGAPFFAGALVNLPDLPFGGVVIGSPVA